MGRRRARYTRPRGGTAVRAPPTIRFASSRRLSSITAAIALLTGCASGSVDDGGPPGDDAGRPSTTIVDAAWLDEVVLPEPLGPLPRHDFADNRTFETHDGCARCHQSQTGSPAMRDEDGRGIGPDELWRSSMMGMSGRDPYWMAVLSHELEENPEAAEAVRHICTRCHAPAANETLGPDAPLTFDAITTEVSPMGHLARDGVTCALCHQITEEGLGTEASFTGGFVINDQMQIYGPHADPIASNMLTATGYEAAYAPHVMRSAMCASCHTVITRALDEEGNVVGPPFPEQVSYLEWRNSDFNDEVPAPGPDARACGSCHLPTSSEAGLPLMVQIANAPIDLPRRSPYGRHTFFGGNAYMLGLLGENLDWVNADVTQALLDASSAGTEANLRDAASLELETAIDGGRLEATVRIENLTGHRLPTSYPSRRVFVRLTVEDATGVVLWRSGRTHALGGLVDRAGDRLDYPGAYMPHLDLVTREDQVQVYEGVMGDLAGRPTRSLLRAAGYLKDNRLQPRGWSPDHPDASWSAPVGLEGDDDFVPGSDVVRYRFALPEGATVVRAELVYQAIPAAAVEHLFDRPTPAIARFDEMRRARPDRGRVMAMQEVLLP